MAEILPDTNGTTGDGFFWLDSSEDGPIWDRIYQTAADTFGTQNAVRSWSNRSSKSVASNLGDYQLNCSSLMKETLALYQEYMPLETDSFEEIRDKGVLLEQALEDQVGIGPKRSLMMKRLEQDDLDTVRLELAKQNQANSTFVIAQGRAQGLIGAYQRRASLLEERATLSKEINESLWPQLVKRLRRWLIDWQLSTNTTDENLSEIKESVTSRMKAFPKLRLEGMTYDERLEVINNYLASDDRSSLLEGRARELKKKIKQVIAIEAKLGAGPSLKTLKMFSEEIVHDLEGEARLLSVKTAKVARRRFKKQLKWGRDEDALVNLPDPVEGITSLWNEVTAQVAAAHDLFDGNSAADRHQQAINERVNPPPVDGPSSYLRSKRVWYRAGFDRDHVIEQTVLGFDFCHLTGADELGPIRAAEIAKEAETAGHNRWALRRLLYQVAREKTWTLKTLKV